MDCWQRLTTLNKITKTAVLKQGEQSVVALEDGSESSEIPYLGESQTQYSPAHSNCSLTQATSQKTTPNQLHPHDTATRQEHISDQPHPHVTATSQKRTSDQPQPQKKKKHSHPSPTDESIESKRIGMVMISAA